MAAEMLQEFTRIVRENGVNLADLSQVSSLGHGVLKGSLLRMLHDIRTTFPAMAVTVDMEGRPTVVPVASALPFLAQFMTIDRSLHAEHVPAQIWTYFDSAQRPVHVDLATESTILCNSQDCQVHLVSNDNLARFIPPPTDPAAPATNDFIPMHAHWQRLGISQQRSRYFAVWVLYNYGGIWLDAGVVSVQSFKGFLEKQVEARKQLTVWQRGATKELEPGVIVSVAQHPVFKRWLLHLHQAMDHRTAGQESTCTDVFELNPLTEIGPCVLTDFVCDHVWDTRDRAYTIDVRDVEEIEPLSDVRELTRQRDDGESGNHAWWHQLIQKRVRAPVLWYDTRAVPEEWNSMSFQDFKRLPSRLLFVLRTTLEYHRGMRHAAQHMPPEKQPLLLELPQSAMQTPAAIGALNTPPGCSIC